MLDSVEIDVALLVRGLEIDAYDEIIKTLAAGAIKPAQGFKFAFEGGADFICVGMFDFQVVEDVLIAKKTLSGNLNRRRPWIKIPADRW